MGLSRLNKLQFKNIWNNLLQMILGIIFLTLGIGISSIFAKIEITNLNNEFVVGNILFWMVAIFISVVALDTTSSVRLYLNTGITRKSIFRLNFILMGITSVIGSSILTLISKILLKENKEALYKFFNISNDIDMFFKILLLFLVIYSIITLIIYSFKNSIKTGVITLILYLLLLNFSIILLIYFKDIIILQDIRYFIIGIILFVTSLIGSKIMINEI